MWRRSRGIEMQANRDSGALPVGLPRRALPIRLFFQTAAWILDQRKLAFPPSRHEVRISTVY
jgi:hypothetical protein